MEAWKDIKKTITSLSEEEKQYISLIAHIVNERHSNGLSQHELAEMTGLKQPAIARFEDPTAGSMPNLLTVLKIVNVLGYELSIKKKEE